MVKLLNDRHVALSNLPYTETATQWWGRERGVPIATITVPSPGSIRKFAPHDHDIGTLAQ